MTILDVTIVNVALVDIKEHLSANVTGLQWIVDGYALVFASFLLTGGALGDKREVSELRTRQRKLTQSGETTAKMSKEWGK